VTQPPRTVPVSGLLVFAAVLAGIIMAAVGIGVECGWGYGLAVGGVGLVVVALWPEGKTG
jgi:hypothetical protein